MINLRVMKLRSQDASLVAGLSAVLAMVISVASLALLFTGHPIFTANVRRQVRFSIVAPYDSPLLAVDRKSVRYDPATGLLSFAAYLGQGGTRLVFSEQATPTGLGVGRGYYGKLLEKLNKYTTVTAPIGTLDITHPVMLAGAESALLNCRGTLVVIRPSTALDVNQWRAVASNLKVMP